MKNYVTLMILSLLSTVSIANAMEEEQEIQSSTSTLAPTSKDSPSTQKSPKPKGYISKHLSPSNLRTIYENRPFGSDEAP